MNIFITSYAAAKLWEYVKAVDGEISGLGVVKAIKGELYIIDLFIIKQKSTGAHTEIDADALGEFMMEAVKDGTFNNMRLWWHSHGNMGVFWSAEDKDTISKFGGDWMLSLVVNRKYETKAQLNTSIPVPLVVENMTMIVAPDIPSEEFIAAIKAEIDAKLSKPVTSVTTWKDRCGTESYSNYRGNSDYNGNNKRDKRSKKDKDTDDWDWRTGYARLENGTIIAYNTTNMTTTRCWIKDDNTSRCWTLREMTPDERRAINADILEGEEFDEDKKLMGFYGIG